MCAQKPRRSAQVVLDTSAIIACVTERVDLVEALVNSLEGEVELLVPSAVVRELTELARGRGRRGVAAGLALTRLRELLEASKLELMETAFGDVDEAVLELSSSLGAWLATADKRLRERARAVGVPVLAFSKSKRRFEPA